jgi:hypothetical protein
LLRGEKLAVSKEPCCVEKSSLGFRPNIRISHIAALHLGFSPIYFPYFYAFFTFSPWRRGRPAALLLEMVHREITFLHRETLIFHRETLIFHRETLIFHREALIFRRETLFFHRETLILHRDH